MRALVRWLRCFGCLRCAIFGSFRPCISRRRRAYLNLVGTSSLLDSTTCPRRSSYSRSSSSSSYMRPRFGRSYDAQAVRRNGSLWPTHRVARFSTARDQRNQSKLSLIPYCPRAGTETRRTQSTSPGAEGEGEERSGNRWCGSRRGTSSRGQSSAVSPTRHLPVFPRCRHSALLPDGPAHADCVCVCLCSSASISE